MSINRFIDQTTNADNDKWIRHAINQVSSTWSDNVSIQQKKKSLNKFGRTGNADDGVLTTIMELPGTEVHETFVTTNAIDRVVSSSASDTEVLKIEGHYYDGSNNLVFTVQEATLTGQTAVTLTQALCRCTRAYVKEGTFGSPASDLVGTVSVYDNSATTVTSGVPNTDSAVKLIITAGQNQSKKCATATSSQDYWFITGFAANMERAGGAAVKSDVQLQYRPQGGVWLPIGAEISLRTDAAQQVYVPYAPYLIIPTNTDVRAVVTASAADTEVAAEIEGLLAIVV